MLGLFKRVAVLPRGLRYKLLLAFCLMSIIPLLVCVYLASIYIFPQIESIVDVSVIVLLSLVIAMVGLVLAKKIVDPVVDMAVEARIIAGGQFDRSISVVGEDEVKELGDSINMMTARIKSNLDELKNYGQKTKEINIDIHKKVLALSNLLQLGDMISSGTVDIDRLLELALSKVAAIFDTGYGAIYLPREEGGDLLVKTAYNLEGERLDEMVIKRMGQGLLEKAFLSRSLIVIDDAASGSKEADGFRAAHNVKNLVAIPLYSGNVDMGLLVTGNRLDDFRYKAEDLDMVKVFAKQMVIAIESDMLIRKNKELAIKDDLTDAYSRNYIMGRLEDEIKRAIFCQRPCSLLMFNIDNFKALSESRGEFAAEDVLKKMSKLMKENVTPIGKVARTGWDEFAILLPEKNKREATHIAEDIRKKVGSAFAKDGHLHLTVSAGVSENPIDGATKDELFKKAMDALKAAKAMGKNRVEA